MRTIKFRAWDNQKKILTTDIAQLSPNHHYLKYREAPSYNEVELVMLYWTKDGNALMQFTGLLDKNGKEIYEGDLLAYRDGNPAIGGYKDLAGGIYQIKWDVYKYRLFRTDNERWLRHTNGVGMIQQHPKQWEIIGNIYENPELIN